MSKTLELSGFSYDIFMQRYAYPGETKWVERAKQIARTAATAELDDKKELIQNKFYDQLRQGTYVPGGRIIFGAGRSKQNMLNCYVLNPEDTVESIGKFIGEVYRISCGGGGIGSNFSSVRPKGDTIGKVAFSAPGAISVMKMEDEIGEHVRAGKNRRTALLGCLDVTHPDLFEFLDVKLNKKELNNFNISVGITDRFIEAVELDEEWFFTFNNRKYYLYRIKDKNSPIEFTICAFNEEDALGRANSHYKTNSFSEFEVLGQRIIKARDIWNWIFKSSVECGDPGIINLDKLNTYTNMTYFAQLRSTNPCGEVGLEDHANCCLGHINLSEMVLEDGSDIDWKKFKLAVHAGVRFLDNILEINHYPLEECKVVAHRSRRIGLGLMGYHYMLIKLGLRYGSEKSLEFTERLCATFRNEAYKASIQLAKEKGPFPAFKASDYLRMDFAKTLPPRIRHDIRKYGIRNAVLLTVAPTGTTSIVMGVSSGIEPIFAALYKRKYRQDNVWNEEIVVDPLFKEWIREGKDPKDLFCGAFEVTPEEHIKVQSTIQKYIDSSISKTCNLPETTKVEDLTDVILEHIRDVKGFTFYRASSKENEPLSAIPLTKENIEKYINNESVVADVTKCSINGGDCG